jgi:hypothetical protein
MERILLVEPNYKNKYPPIGLMKISTYYKNKGDFVEFHKGLLPQNKVQSFDRVLITTLFTFDFTMCVQTIRYYIEIVGLENVYVGGIAATIMPDNFLKAIPGLNILTGQLTSSQKLGYDEDVNIDLLDLDYDILWDISYDYPMANSYFIYTSRGCPRKCDFCAVKTLEPKFYDCLNIENQVNAVDRNFGTKRQLLIMDNNILFSPNFNNAIDRIRDLGFGINNNKIKKGSNMGHYILSLSERINISKQYSHLLKRIQKDFINLKFQRISKADTLILNSAIEKINNNNESAFILYIFENSAFLSDFFERYNYHKITRFVDFNQGLDARLFTKTKAEKMAELAINPCRIAFDDLDTTDEYFKAMEASVQSGIAKFSNYLLYNFKEKPEDLWKRLFLNIQFCKKHANISLFSFPMKYAAIDHTDRSYIGQYWNKKYLRALNVILNVTSGVVAKEEDFFLRAFGHNEEEFIEILTMPDEFIRYRDFFEDKGLTQLWKALYARLSAGEKEELISILEQIVDDPDIICRKFTRNINDILFYYTLRKKSISDNPLFYSNLVNYTKQEIAI